MKTKFILLGIATALGLAACNTISGIGKDVESVGTNLDAASKATKQSIHKHQESQ